MLAQLGSLIALALAACSSTDSTPAAESSELGKADASAEDASGDDTETDGASETGPMISPIDDPLTCDVVEGTIEGCPDDEGVRCVDGVCVDGNDEVISIWIGEPCEECDLETQIENLVGPVDVDCGVIGGDGGADRVTCAQEAFGAGTSFMLIRQAQGIDSVGRTAWAFDGDQPFVFGYDSNVCGGGPSCPSGPQHVPVCGPMVSVRVCEGASVATDGEAPFDCTSDETTVLCMPQP